MDSTASHRAADTTGRRAAPAPSVPLPAAPTAVASAADTTVPPAGPGDTISVRTKRVVYRFSTVGAALTGSELLDYKALTRGDGPVQLARPNSRLIEYRLLVGGRDTVPLDRMPFSVDSSALTESRGSLTFRTSAAGSNVAITYTFSPDSYLVHVRGTVQGGTAQNRRLLITLLNGLHSEEADTLDDQRHFAYVMKPIRDDARGVSFTKLEAGKPATQSGSLEWVASKSKYFVLALFADTTVAPFSGATLWLRPDSSSKVARTADAVVDQPVSANGTFAFDVYTGPQEWRRLLALGHGFQNVNPYGGFFRAIVQPFATIVMRVLLWMHDHLRINYGWVLIIFGVAVRLILWPLNQGAMRSSLKLQRIQPELQVIQKKYKNNLEKQQAEMMRLYKEHGMSPFSPLAGCLPMLIPMPVLFALYFVFLNTIEFRGVSFLWMTDISLKDPYYILPVLMGLSMFVLSWIGLRSSPPNAQAKMMAYVFPVLMTVFFLKLAAGLNLYYAVQNIAALPQQWMIARERAKGAVPAPRPAG